MNNSMILIGIIIVLSCLCIYIYITKNNEIDDLSKDSDCTGTVPNNLFSNVNSELQSCHITLNELQEECNTAGIGILQNLGRFVAGQDNYRQGLS